VNGARAARIAIAAAGLVLGVFAYRILRDDLHQTVARSLPAVAIGWSGIVSGLIAWRQRPANHLGPLMCAYGLAVLIRPWQYSGDALVFTIGYALGELNIALFGHTTLAYPFGRVTDRLERWLVRVGYALALGFPLLTLLVYDGSGLDYVPPGPESLLLVDADGGLARDLEQAFVVSVYGILAALFVALVVRKLVRATPRMRRLLTPLLLAALIAASRAISESAFAFVSPPPVIVDRLYWWQVAGQILLPITLLVGLLRARLARAHVGDLLLELDHTPPEGVRDALARHLGDPTLELVFWLPERDAYVDAAGAAVTLPERGEGRSVSEIAHEGEPVAAIVYDPSLDEEPELVRSAGTAARFALENARLHAEVRAQLAEVQESRRRIVTAGDEQRRRIERDIHDGAQQRLVALALELRATQKRLGARVDPDVERVLSGAVEELQVAVAELRELARGVHPAILTEEGLAGALESLASRTPLDVRVEEAPEERLPAEIEAAGYFVACEALANAVKHADSSAVRIRAMHRSGRLTVEVVDDGRGGADPLGAGLHGLADRLEALGGRLTVASAPGGGTRIVGDLPCES
jgi:signal transduction histidine kinase